MKQCSSDNNAELIVYIHSDALLHCIYLRQLRRGLEIDLIVIIIKYVYYWHYTHLSVESQRKINKYELTIEPNLHGTKNKLSQQFSIILLMVLQHIIFNDLNMKVYCIVYCLRSEVAVT